jgi:site-specific recombinase XerD
MENNEKQGENDMNAIAQRITTAPAGSIEEMALRISREAPTLASLTGEQLEQIARLVITQRLAGELNQAADLAGINYQAEKETFLNNAGKTDSAHTRAGYRTALGRLDAWTAKNKINPLALSPAQADDFIYSLRERAAASIRLDAAACSSFFTFMERRHGNMKNPFRGTKARPGKKAAKKTEIPTAGEVKVILAALPAHEAAAASVMVYRGLRAGALPTLAIREGNRYTGRSKGKDIAGELPAQAVKAIEAAALPGKAPFAGILPNTLEKRIARSIEKLYKTGKVKAAYSCHDLRHFFAVTEYRKDHDVHRLKKLLDHASIQITDTYLKGLGETV